MPVSQDVADYNARVSEELRAEGKNVKKARFIVGKITRMEQQLCELRAKVAALEFELCREIEPLHVYLTEALRAGESGWSAPWANYWRTIGIPHYRQS